MMLHMKFDYDRPAGLMFESVDPRTDGPDAALQVHPEPYNVISNINGSAYHYNTHLTKLFF